MAAAKSRGNLLTCRICDADIRTTEGKVAGNHADFHTPHLLTRASYQTRRRGDAIYNAERDCRFKRARVHLAAHFLTSYYHFSAWTHSPNKLCAIGSELARYSN